ncbi:conserved membrane hypothetical protein [Hyphomicrobiales bacterium]|nr:conserved membrane hypothetical protein [Hyphomicrobiales bacterium]CAH1691667.1 conserved membrane hypothetical protein [Hyphomicrobiales bacterium]
MDDVILARALHVLAVIHWIGSLAFVTLVVLPLSATKAREGIALFEAVERRFSRQVRISVPVVGLSGFWMTWRMDIWDRFHDPEYWWMGAMLGLWLLFILLLFVIEPIIARRPVERDPVATVRRLSTAHRILLLAAVLTALGAVAGAHGFSF